MFISWETHVILNFDVFQFDLVEPEEINPEALQNLLFKLLDKQQAEEHLFQK